MSDARNRPIFFSKLPIPCTRRSSRSSNRSGGSFIRRAKLRSAGDAITPTTCGRRRRRFLDLKEVRAGSSTSTQTKSGVVRFLHRFHDSRFNALAINAAQPSFFQRTWREYRTRDSLDRLPEPGPSSYVFSCKAQSTERNFPEERRLR